MTAARRLQRAGARVVLLERSYRLGGIMETTVDDGFVVEGGPDNFVTGKGAVLDLAADLGIEGEVIPANPESRGSFVLWDGRLHPLPGGLLLMVPSRMGPFLRSTLLSWRGKAGALKDLVAPRSAGNGDESLASFVRRRLGAEVLERIAEPLIAGIHAAEPETMSLRASFPRFLEMEARDRSLILAARRIDTSGGDGRSHFSSFRLGMGQLAAALAGELDGVEVRTGVETTAIETESGGYLVQTAGGERVATSGVVLAVPAPVATGLLAGLSPQASAAIDGITQVSNQAVTLAFRSETLPDLAGSGFVVPSAQEAAIRGVSYLSRKWAGRVPDMGFSLLRVFLKPGRPGSPVDIARAGLEASVGITADPVRTWVRDHPQGLHRYTLGHLERVAEAERLLGDVPGVALAGAGFHGVGLNECIGSGDAAGERVLESLGSTVDGR